MQKIAALWPKKKCKTGFGFLVPGMLFFRFPIFVPLRLCAFASFFLPLWLYSVSFAQQPNYTETTIKNVDGAGQDIVSRSYRNGQGQLMQSQTLTNGTKSVNVSGLYYDKMGRADIVVKAFPYLKTNANLDFIKDHLITGWNCANTYYSTASGHPDAAGFPFSSVNFSLDPLGLPTSTGAPGAVFSTDEVNGGHPGKMWYFGVTGTGNSSDAAALFDDNGFIKSSYLNELSLVATIPANLALAPPSSLLYFLYVIKDPNSSYMQIMKDIFGNTLRTWSMANGTDGPIVGKYEYDILGKTTTATPPATTPLTTNVSASTYGYNALGHLTSKTTPDQNTISYIYDDAGRLQQTRDANMASMTPVEDLVFKYDAFNRNITVSRCYSNGGLVDNSDTRLRNVYDIPEDARKFLANSAFPTGTQLDNILSGLTNTRGRVVAAVAYDDNFSSVSTADVLEANEADYKGKVIDLFSYNDQGLVCQKYKSIPGLPLQTYTNTFDIHGKLVSETLVISGIAGSTVTHYSYDVNGRLVKITRNGKDFISYAYDELGKITGKTFKNGAIDIDQVNYSYNIRDWATDIKTGGVSPLFEQKLYFDANGATVPAATFSPQYDGNISRSTITYGVTGLNPIDATLDLFYTYDNVGRLNQVQNAGASGTSTATDDKYDASFFYLNDGRMRRKREGLTQALWDNYKFYGATNKIVGIGSSPKDGNAGSNPNYIYDLNGNMVLDRSKKMVVEYDWNDMPVRFLVYSDIPATVTTWDDVKNLKTNSNITITSEVVMTYDATGNRVLKKEIDHSTTTPPVAPTNALLVANTVEAEFAALDITGNLITNVPVESMGSNPVPDGALVIENILDGQVIGLSQTGFQTSSSIVSNQPVLTDEGSLNFDYEPSVETAAALSQDGGYVGVAGSVPSNAVSGGVAYADDAVYTWNSGTQQWDLSYVKVANEGQSLADGSTFRYLVKDVLGSTRFALNDDNTLHDPTGYLAYGTSFPLKTVPPGEVVKEKFTGKELDAEANINLNYFGARYYDPEIASWTGADPAEEFWNSYSYVGGDPVNYTDPSGLLSEPTIIPSIMPSTISNFSPSLLINNISEMGLTSSNSTPFAGLWDDGSLDWNWHLVFREGNGGDNGDDQYHGNDPSHGSNTGGKGGDHGTQDPSKECHENLNGMLTMMNLGKTPGGDGPERTTKITIRPINVFPNYAQFHLNWFTPLDLPADSKTKTITDNHEYAFGGADSKTKNFDNDESSDYAQAGLNPFVLFVLIKSSSKAVVKMVSKLFVKKVARSAVNLSRAQANRLKSIYEIAHNWKVRKTLSGENIHIQKIQEGIQGLANHRDALIKSLDNPTLNDATREAIQQGINTANELITKATKLLGGL